MPCDRSVRSVGAVRRGALPGGAAVDGAARDRVAVGGDHELPPGAVNTLEAVATQEFGDVADGVGYSGMWFA
ncbi:hypothetical protein EHYA_03487 [Embleya hyalina]|uniref:Uncharacterized protein n=1 Tax=Embleya hyalina TaxID=516124 RepID=A0A401YMG0_9ACTN|nr:hypothetical protein EHYA_03487 [Embleya hyalina]